MAEKPKSKILTRQEELMLALNITEDDIIANRNGQLLPEHRKTILKREKHRNPFVGCGALVILGMLFLAVIGFRDEGITGCISVTLVIIMLLAVEVPEARKLIQFRQDMQAGVVESLQGLAVVEAGRGYSLSMNDIRFEAPQQVMLRIKHLEPHIFHYLPKSKIIVSVEVVEA